MDKTALYILDRIRSFCTTRELDINDHNSWGSLNKPIHRQNSFPDGGKCGAQWTPDYIAQWVSPICVSMDAKVNATNTVYASSAYLGEGVFVSSWHGVGVFQNTFKYVYSGHNPVGHHFGNYFGVNENDSSYLNHLCLDICFLKVSARKEDLPTPILKNVYDGSLVKKFPLAVLFGYGSRIQVGTSSNARNDVVVQLIEPSMVEKKIAEKFTTDRGEKWSENYLTAVSVNSGPSNSDSGGALVSVEQKVPTLLGIESLSYNLKVSESITVTYSLYAKASRISKEFRSHQKKKGY